MKKVSSPVILVLLMALISFMCLSLSVSYSYVYGTRAASNTQSIQTGNLEADIAYSSLALNLTPMSDEEGLSQDEYSTITINKNNEYSVYYNISLGYNLDSTVGRTLDELLPLENIKVALFPYEGGNISPSPIVGPVAIGNLPLFTSSDNILNDSYSLAVGTFSPGQSSNKFALKIWLDIETDDKYDDRLIFLGVKIKQEPLLSKNIYTLSGSVTLDGNPVTSAEVSLQDGLKKASTESGAYTLNEVIEGTYNLSVKLPSGRVYETNVNLGPGTTIGVSENPSTAGASGTFIQKAAYSNYTTPLKIIKYNSLTTDSNEITTSGYNMPKSYLITGEEIIGIQSLSGININLTSSGNISLAQG